MRAGLVTGGSSGIGKALARALGEEGYAVKINGRDEGKLAAGVIALTESAQAEARDARIQFTIFTPGFTTTRMARWVREVEFVPRAQNEIIRRLAAARERAAT